MSLAKSSSAFAAGTLLSRVTGVLRESAVGAVLGASVYMDAFVVAFRIPNLLRELLAEGALGSSFTKVYASLAATDAARAEKLLIQFLQFVALLSSLVCIVGIAYSDVLVDLLVDVKATYQDQAAFQSASIAMTRLLFPFIAFSALGAVVMGALYQRGGFFLSAVAPILFNIASIVGVYYFGFLSERLLPPSWLVPFGSNAVLGLALGTLLGGFLQMLWQVQAIWRPLLAGRGLFRITILPWSKDIAKVLVLMGPMVLAGSAGQINTIVNSNFATSVGTGAVSWLNYAFRFVQLPIGMFGVAISAAILPSLSKSIAKAGGKFDEGANMQMQQALELVVWLMVPCMLFIEIAGHEVTALLYQAGRFTENDTASTAAAMRAYSLGLVGYGLLKVLNSFYYAVDRTRYPMLVSIFSIAVNYIGNAMLVQRFGHVGLARTASITLTLNAVLLLIGVRHSGFQWQRHWLRSFLGTLITASIIAAALGVACHRLMIGLAIQEHLEGIVTKTIAVKLNALVVLIGVGSVVAGAFVSIGLRRLGKSPRTALQMLKRSKG